MISDWRRVQFNMLGKRSKGERQRIPPWRGRGG